MDEYAVPRSALLSVVQAAIGWATLALILILVLFHGGNSPVYWMLFGPVAV